MNQQQILKVLENEVTVRRPGSPPLTHRQKFERDRKRAGYRSIICEGDSWFRNVSRWTTIPQWLNSDKLGLDYKYAVLNLADAGHTAKQIADNIYPAARDVERYQPDIFALSAGGNDLLNSTNLQQIIARKGDAGYLVEARFLAFTKTLAADIWTIASEIEAASHQIPIFWHSYDYPIPSGKGIVLGPITVGPWLKPALEAKGYHDAAEQRKVVKHILDRFSDAQKSIVKWIRSGKADKAVKPNIHFVNLKGTVPDEKKWPDEIHPDSGSNKVLAKKIKDAIHAAVPR